MSRILSKQIRTKILGGPTQALQASADAQKVAEGKAKEAEAAKAAAELKAKDA